MKIIQIDQPWASLVVSGVMDVVQAIPGERSYRGMALVVSSDKENPENELDRIPYEWVQVLMNGVYTGNLPEFNEMPIGKAVGVVEVIDYVEEAYSMWDSNDGKPKFRLANARVFRRPVKNWLKIDENNIPPAYSHKKKEINLDRDKFIMPVGDTAYERYISGEFSTINLLIDEDVERCGLFPDLSSYEPLQIDRVELVNGKKRALFNVTSIEAGIRLDSDGNEIYLPSIYEEKRPFEIVSIRLGMRKMWIA